MDQTSRFIRGQVWRWEDPIYGSKHDRMMIDIGEAGLRYSRYVIIVQSTNTIEHNRIMVVPCSSHRAAVTDVEIPISGLTFLDGQTFCRPNSLFPVHPRNLTHYICQLSDDVMKNIDAEIVRYLVPCITENTETMRDFKKAYGIDVAAAVERGKNAPIFNGIQLNGYLKEFIATMTVEQSEGSTTLAEMKEAYDQFCGEKNIEMILDIGTFADRFSSVAKTNFIQKHHGADMPVFKGRILKGKIINQPTANNTIEIKADAEDGKSEKITWDDAKRAEFVSFYDKNGKIAAALEYNITESTAMTYYGKFRRGESLNRKPHDVSTKKQVESTLITPEVVIPKDLRLDVDYTIGAKESISRMTNLIKQYARAQDYYNNMYKPYELKVSSRMTDEDFYTKFGNGVYYAILTVLDIHEITWKNLFEIPVVTKDTPALDTWKLVHMLHFNKDVSNLDPLEFMEYARKTLGPNVGICPGWMNSLKANLTRRLNMKGEGIKAICWDISNQFSEKRI